MLPQITALLLLSPVTDVSLFVGAPGATGDVQVVDQAGTDAPSVPPGLAGIELLAIEVAGRTRIDEFQPHRARRIAIPPSAARLALPDARGSLYRFRRSEAGGATYGFFAVGPEGGATSLFERPGSGASADVDPFVDRVAVAPDGASFLVATTVEAGGDLFEVALDGSVQHRSQALAPHAVNGSGLALFATWGTAAGANGIVRFERAEGAQAQAVVLPGEPVWFGGEVVGSRDGMHAATTAGSSPMDAFVFTFGALGSAVQATASPQPITGAGFLPEHLDGPFLAVADGAGVVAWRTEVDLVREAWIGASGGATAQLTMDGVYLDTLDQAGVLMFDTSGSLLMAVGEAPELGEEGLESMDLYRVEVSGGAPVIQNLSLSSGLSQPPFFIKSDIDPEDGMYAVPGTDWVLIHDSQSSSGELIAVDVGAGSVQTVLANVKSLDLVEMTSDHLLVSVRREAPDSRQLVRLDAETMAPTILGRAPSGAEFSRPAVRSDGRAAIVVEFFGLEWLAKLDLASESGALFLSTPLSYGSTTAFGADGALLFTAGVAGFPQWALAWPDAGVPTVPLAAPFFGFVLPGA